MGSTSKNRENRSKLLIFLCYDVTEAESIFRSSLSSSLCLLHSSVSNGKQSVDVVLGNVSRTRHKGKRRESAKGGGHKKKREPEEKGGTKSKLAFAEENVAWKTGKLDKWNKGQRQGKVKKKWRKKNRKRQKERKSAYLTRTLDSSHLFENSTQPFSLLMLVARLAFAPWGLRGNKHNGAYVLATTTSPSA